MVHVCCDTRKPLVTTKSSTSSTSNNFRKSETHWLGRWFHIARYRGTRWYLWQDSVQQPTFFAHVDAFAAIFQYILDQYKCWDARNFPSLGIVTQLAQRRHGAYPQGSEYHWAQFFARRRPWSHARQLCGFRWPCKRRTRRMVPPSRIHCCTCLQQLVRCR